MTIYERYCQIRDSKGLKDSNVASMAKIGKSTFSDWKSGRSEPKNEKLAKIANALDVSLDYLINGREDDEEKYYINDETAEVAQEIFENRELRALFDVQRNMSADDLKALHNMALALKRKERGEDDY